MRNQLSKMLRLTIVAGAVVVSASSTTPASAFTGPVVADQIHHYIECATWLLTDPAKHAKYCSPAAPYVNPWTKDTSHPVECSYDERSLDFVKVEQVIYCDE